MRKIISIILLLIVIASYNLISQELVRTDRQGDGDYLINIALNRPAHVSSVYTTAFSGANAVDGNHNTVWGSSTNTATQWIYIDLGQIEEINGIGLHWYGQYYAKTYDIYSSNDQSNWTKLATYNKTGEGADIFTGNISLQYRYMAILCKVKNSHAYGLAEFEIYRKQDPPPTPSPSPTVTPTASSVIRPVNADELLTALNTVEPGQMIELQSGTVYTNTKVNEYPAGSGRWAYFGSMKSGTASNRIILTSSDPTNPAILEGDIGSAYCLYLNGGNYWEISHVIIRNARQGLIIDNSNYTIINNVEVYNVGQEGIHIRDGSSNNIVDGCNIHDIGKTVAGYGEGVYVGTDKGSWTKYAKECYDNVIKNCTFGPNIPAEHLDIKEGTRRTIVEYNTFNGTGISGANSATSYVSCKGIDAIIRYNTGYRNNNSIIDSAFSCNNRGVEDSGYGNWFYYNTLHMDDTETWVVRTKQGTCQYKVWENTRDPAGNMYQTYSGSSYEEVKP